MSDDPHTGQPISRTTLSGPSGSAPAPEDPMDTGPSQEEILRQHWEWLDCWDAANGPADPRSGKETAHFLPRRPVSSRS